jgi:hypothetical protein
MDEEEIRAIGPKSVVYVCVRDHQLALTIDKPGGRPITGEIEEVPRAVQLSELLGFKVALQPL